MRIEDGRFILFFLFHILLLNNIIHYSLLHSFLLTSLLWIIFISVLFCLIIIIRKMFILSLIFILFLWFKLNFNFWNIPIWYINKKHLPFTHQLRPSYSLSYPRNNNLLSSYTCIYIHLSLRYAIWHEALSGEKQRKLFLLLYLSSCRAANQISSNQNF